MLKAAFTVLESETDLNSTVKNPHDLETRGFLLTAFASLRMSPTSDNFGFDSVSSPGK